GGCAFCWMSAGPFPNESFDEDPPAAKAPVAQSSVIARTPTSTPTASSVRRSSLCASSTSFTPFRRWSSRDPSEPEGGEAAAEEQQHGAGPGKGRGQLPLFVLVRDLGADLLVDRLEISLGRSLEETPAGLFRDRPQRRAIGWDGIGLGLAEIIGDLGSARVRGERDRIDGDARLLHVVEHVQRLAAGRVRPVGEQEHREERLCPPEALLLLWVGGRGAGGRGG